MNAAWSAGLKTSLRTIQWNPQRPVNNRGPKVVSWAKAGFEASARDYAYPRPCTRDDLPDGVVDLKDDTADRR